MTIRHPFARSVAAAPGLLAWALLVMAPAAAGAATWYVSTTGTQGADVHTERNL